ncbi:hypothetical protein DFQ28_008333 [Apophysomyces sp. BC1034]|nr:hypothetical protein DFQ30_008053 [Apophysomyces sp. BC1015]KAG0175586.1 hypothetical protein DFQ29_007088 [Apophysomyces sp. BC1021]KAG0186101.1 hypothetical protein DFQ28_008333 [Apophysomyces sp. BC1034]
MRPSLSFLWLAAVAGLVTISTVTESAPLGDLTTTDEGLNLLVEPLIGSPVREFDTLEKRASKKKKSTKKKSSSKKKKPSKKPTKKKQPAKKQPAKKKPSSSGGGGTKFTGDGTFFNPGMGSCGGNNGNSDMIAALNAPQMGQAANPNLNPMCGKYAKVTGPKGTVRVKIVDTCPPCKKGSLDLSPAAFIKIADLSAGRVPISWTWD